MKPNGLEWNQTAAGRRVAILIATFLVASAGPLAKAQSAAPATERPVIPVSETGTGNVSGLVVKKGRGSTWIAEFDCFYEGKPERAQVRLETDAGPGKHSGTFINEWVKPGSNHFSTPISYPGDSVTTTAVTAVLSVYNQTLASQRVEQVIHWPSPQLWMHDQEYARYTPEQTLARAIEFIDSEKEPLLAQAKLLLERLLEENPQLDQAYVELARIAMKTNWNTEGLHQGEGLLRSALQIRPDSVNAKILLGYVFANQHHFAEAEAMFAGVAASNPHNLWLWTNWGELLLMEGKPDQAIAKFQEAVNRPMTHDTYDHARLQAYTHLLMMFEDRKNFDAMEALYKKRVAEFTSFPCYSIDYARFVLQIRGDTQRTIDLMRDAMNQSCEDPEVREVLGMAEYARWAATRSPESTEALNQARIFLPVGAKPLYLLATSERTMPAVKHLLADGEKIDQKDSEGLTALAHALQNHDPQATKRLLALGADPATPVTYADFPVALVPVMDEDLQGIRILRQSGVDYSKLSYRGMTAIEMAKRAGKKALLEALGGDGSTL